MPERKLPGNIIFNPCCYCGNYDINIYISREISIEHPSVGLASLAQLLISQVVSYFHEPEASANTAYE